MPPDFHLRPPRPEEAPAIAGLLNVYSQALHGTDDVDDNEIRGWFEIPSLDPERDMLLAVASDGKLLGYANVSDGGERKVRYWLDVRVPPDSKSGVLPALLDALETRARETAAAGARAGAFIPGKDEGMAPILTGRGYELVRHDFVMEAELGEEPPRETEWPEGIALEPYADDDARRVYEADMKSFADHWEFEREPYEDWAHGRFREPHDPSLWFLAVDRGELAGICLCRPHRTGNPELGWVSVLGVLRPWRRRGLGLALLRHAFREFHRRGLRRVGLRVDAENTTGAVRLYERAGMRPVRRNDIYMRDL